MTKTVYISSAELHAGKSGLALGIVEALARRGDRVGVFRPLVHDTSDDPTSRELIATAGLDEAPSDAVCCTYAQAATNPEKCFAAMVAQMGALRNRYDAVVVIGSDFRGVSSPIEVDLNARIAANLDCPIIALVSGADKDVAHIRRSAQYLLGQFRHEHVDVLALVVNRVAPELVDAVRADLADHPLAELGAGMVSVLPHDPILSAPTVREQVSYLDAQVLHGSPDALDRESTGTLMAGMTLPNLLTRLRPDITLLIASDRTDLLTGVLAAQESGAAPRLAAIVLIGGYALPDDVLAAVQASPVDIVVAAVDTDSYATATRLNEVVGSPLATAERVAELRQRLARDVDWDAFAARVDAPRRALRTQHRFEYDIMEAARANKQTVVLPESGDDRVLTAAAITLERGVANIVLLGEPDEVAAHAARLGVDVSGARIASMTDEAALTRYATAYAELRKAKGVTLDQAKAKLADPSYWGTMMVKLGEADAMVSGATHTTANTIRPAFEVIKAKPDAGIVSGAFFMCMADQVWLFADPAVNPNPTPEQLASIAISSAESAAAFGIEPRVAMLSYSTGTSGAGPDVDAVVEATRIVRERRPDLPVEGPIQFDAAVAPTVAALKMPGSPVAGQATVFIFPDLDAGNITYKAVQRTSGATAVGPILQGLNKTVTDLSRGALVDDIVSTIAITAVQAQAS